MATMYGDRRENNKLEN